MHGDFPEPVSIGELRGSEATRKAAVIAARIANIPITITDGEGPLVLETSLGSVTGHSAVIRYIAESSPNNTLNGTNNFEEAQVHSWVEFSTLELSAHTDSIPPTELVANALSSLNDALSQQTFLVGQRLSLADIAVVCAVDRFLQQGGVSGDLQHLYRWHATCMHQPQFSDLFTAYAAPVAHSSSTPASTPSTQSASCELIDASDNAAIQLLDQLGIKSATYAHPEAFTVEEQAAHVSHLPGLLTKNLLLKDKKHGMFMVVCQTERNTKDTKTLGKLLKLQGSSNLRLCDEKVLFETLGVKRGALSYLAIMNDPDNKVTLAVDKGLLEGNVVVNAHPLRCDRTTSVHCEGVKKFLAHCNHEPLLIDFGNSASSGPAAEAPKAKQPKDKAAKQQPKGGKQQKQQKGQTKLGLMHTKEGNFADWYPEVVEKSEMLSYGDISGCYIIRPWGFAMWEQIWNWFDREIKKLDVENCYFPLFVSQHALEKEKNHVEGFAPEVAWVTRSGETELNEPIAVRPTSETIMYPEFARWIHSHRDLPVKVNQWCNVVRWEFKFPTPFLRSREFLWQEGHTAHATREEADEMVYDILELYKQVYEHLMAIPVIKGVKTESEKFAGGFFTTTCEAYIATNGRAIQGATSHNLGQNFGKMFDISFEDKDKTKKIPWQTSWGLTTRTLGVMVMSHADNQGLVLPPRIAPLQVIIVTIPNKDVPIDDMNAYARDIEKILKLNDIRCKADLRDNYNPGWKYNHWELKGVPIRIEIGKSEVLNKTVTMAYRFTGTKEPASHEGLVQTILTKLEDLQNMMLHKSTEARNAKLAVVTDWKDFVPALNDKCLCLTPFCDEEEEEDNVKERSRSEALDGADEDERSATPMAAKTLCKPLFPQAGLPDVDDISNHKCFATGKPARAWVLWGRSY